MAYKTPGVYAEEVSTLPPSVAEVSTAIPAFIGYTSAGKKTARITTMLEYETIFGLPPAPKFKVTPVTPESNGNGAASGGSYRTAVAVAPAYKVEIATQETQYLMYYSLKLYFNNGGGACYVVSIGVDDGKPENKPKADDFANGLAELEKEDEPTLIVLTDAVNLDRADYNAVYEQALSQCAKLGDRFVIIDVMALKKNEIEALTPRTEAKIFDESIKLFRDGISSDYLKYGAAYTPYIQTALPVYYDEEQVEIEKDKSLWSERLTNTALYNEVKALLSQQRIILPPSAAVAGAYARVDRDRGVWKAPANVSLSSVIGPVTKITQDAQENLNVDATGGKSINAIRAFTGKGTLVWGARTLAGNDNEWRYVSVRRLFNMIEESTLKASSFAVFEPNDASTWLKVKAMIESYLYGLWEQGALAGPTPAAAYFVSVGLGKTMTTQDILEGRMIVKIGVAAVRPSEFIILQFSHKLQEA